MSLLAIAQGDAPSARRSRASSAAKKSGTAFEDVFAAVVGVYPGAFFVHGHPETRVVPDGRGGRKVIYLRKNGVDFVGAVGGCPMAIELKRLPGAASLTGSKDDSTEYEAKVLIAMQRAGGVGAFLVHDPRRGTVAMVTGYAHLSKIAVGARVGLRDRYDRALVPTWGDTNADGLPVVLNRLIDDVLFQVRAGLGPESIR